MDIKRKIISYVAKEHPTALWSSCLLAEDIFFKFPLVATVMLMGASTYTDAYVPPP